MTYADIVGFFSFILANRAAKAVIKVDLLALIPGAPAWFDMMQSRPSVARAHGFRPGCSIGPPAPADVIKTRLALVGWEFRAAWVVWIDPVLGNDRRHSQRRWDLVDPNELIGALMPVIDPSLLVAQRHAFKAVAINRFLDPSAKCSIFQ